MVEAQWLVEHFGMVRLPIEDTLYASTYRADGDRPAGTAIVGLLSEELGSRSLFHRLTQDEVWHFYAGDPIRLLLLGPDASRELVLGADLAAGQQVQAVVPAGVWQAAETTGRWSLYGCTMAPGFTPGCFEGGSRSALARAYPDRLGDIDRLALPDGHPAAMPEDVV